MVSMGFPGGSEVKVSACNAGDLGSIPGSGRSPGEGNGNPVQYSCLENPMDRGARWAAVHGATKSRTQLSPHSTHCYGELHGPVTPEGAQNHTLSRVLNLVWYFLDTTLQFVGIF